MHLPKFKEIMAQQKFKVKISKKYNTQERVAIGLDVIEKIIERSQSGKDKKGKNFPGYSEGYVKSFDFKLAGKNKNKVDLSLSEEMLNALTILDNKAGEITIGYTKDDKFNNDKAEGNILGTYGQKKPIRGKKRDFLGITRDEKKAITDNYPTKSKDKDSNSLLKTLLATEASREIAGQFLDVEALDNEL